MSHKKSPVSASTPPSQHPLQRLPSPALHGISPILHFLLLSAHVSSFTYLHTNPTPINDSYGWHFQYLTIIGLLISTLTFFLASLADILSPLSASNSLSHTLMTLKNSLLQSLSLPVAFLITLLYWSLRIISKDLVMPPWAQLPLMPDLSFHLLPLVGNLFDFLFLSPPPTVSPLQGLGWSAALAAAYWPWVELCAGINGFYPYPIFELVGTGGRVGLFVGSAVVMAGNVALGRWAWAVVNGVEGGDKVTLQPGVGKKGEEPEALRQLRSSVNGSLRRKEDMVRQGQ